MLGIGVAFSVLDDEYSLFKDVLKTGFSPLLHLIANTLACIIHELLHLYWMERKD